MKMRLVPCFLHIVVLLAASCHVVLPDEDTSQSGLSSEIGYHKYQYQNIDALGNPISYSGFWQIENDTLFGITLSNGMIGCLRKSPIWAFEDTIINSRFHYHRKNVDGCPMIRTDSPVFSAKLLSYYQYDNQHFYLVEHIIEELKGFPRLRWAPGGTKPKRIVLISKDRGIVGISDNGNPLQPFAW